MKAYKKLVNEKDLVAVITEIIQKEKMLDGGNTEVFIKEIQEGLYDLFYSQLQHIQDTQKQVCNNFKNKDKLNKELLNFDNGINKIYLSGKKSYLKNLISTLKQYKEILDLVYIGKINSLWLYKILDKDEFNSKLNINLFLMQTLSSWKDRKFGDKSKRYLEYLQQLRNLMHKEDFNN